MEAQMSSIRPSGRRASRMRSRIVFFLLRRLLRGLAGGAKARISRALAAGQYPRPLRIES